MAVVATTTQIGDFAREVGGDDVDVTQILAPNTDPHDYEPRPDDVTNTADAKIVFENGDNLDAWMGKVVDDSGSDAKVVDLGASVPVKLPGESSGPEASQYDPHWWHDPRNAEAAVREIATQLSAIDPKDKATFAANAAAYEAKLKALDSGIAHCFESVPASDRKLVTDHDAFGYFANRYGIQVVGAVIPSQTTQAQPNAQDLSDLADLVRSEHVKAIFPESSLSPKLAETHRLADRRERRPHLYGDTLGPKGSSGDTYLKMEAANAEADGRGIQRGRHRQRRCRDRGRAIPAGGRCRDQASASQDWQPATAALPAIEEVTFEVDVGAARRAARAERWRQDHPAPRAARRAAPDARDRRGPRPGGDGPADGAVPARLPRLGARRRADGRASAAAVVEAAQEAPTASWRVMPSNGWVSPEGPTTHSVISPAASASGC